MHLQFVMSLLISVKVGNAVCARKWPIKKSHIGIFLRGNVKIARNLKIYEKIISLLFLKICWIFEIFFWLDDWVTQSTLTRTQGVNDLRPVPVVHFLPMELYQIISRVNKHFFTKHVRFSRSRLASWCSYSLQNGFVSKFLNFRLAFWTTVRA